MSELRLFFSAPAQTLHSTYDGVAYISCRTLAELRLARAHPARYFCETEDEVEASVGLPPPFLAMPELGFSLTSHTSYRLPVARILAQALIARLLPQRSHAEDLTLLLHEAIINAVVHGNLAVDSHFATPGQLAQFVSTIHKKLRQPHFAQMRAYVHAWQKNMRLVISVTHSGSGRLTSLALPTSIETPYGRGLPLMHALAHSLAIRNQGRSLEMIW